MPDKEEIRLDSSIYHGMDELQKFMLDSTCFDLAYFSSIVMTDRHATVINFKTGLYWVFSLEKAALAKAGKIFSEDKMTLEMIAKGGFANAVLCAFPEKAGTILVSTQMEAAFTTETGDALRETDEFAKRQPPGQPPTPADLASFARRRYIELAEQNPYIEWHRIYPENGRVEKLSLPPEGAALDREGVKNDNWRPLPDGSVRMGWLGRTALKQVQKAQEVQVTIAIPLNFNIM